NGPNELSRIEAFVAFVEHGTFAIDSTIRKYGDHQDKSVYGGHSYSNKAPGLIFACAAVYRVLRIFAVQPSNPRAPLFVVVTLLPVTVASVLARDRCSRRRARELFHDETRAVLLAVALGTPFLFYGRSLFSHAWTAALLYLAWDDMVVAEEKRSGWPTARAGFLAAFAAISEYTAAPVLILLGLRVVWERRTAPLPRFAAGALTPPVPLSWSTAPCFGSAWSLSSAHESLPQFAEAARQGIFGIGPPSLRVVFAFLFDPSRGFVLFSPFWLWALLGFVSLWSSGKSRRACASSPARGAG